MAKRVKTRRATQQSSGLLHHIRVTGHGEGPNGERFVRLRIKEDSEKRDVLVRTDNIASGKADYMSKLNQRGAHLISSKARTAFVQMLQDAKPSGERFPVATRPGLVGSSFVLPDMTIRFGGQRVETYFDDLPSDILAKFRCAGTLKGWSKIAELAKHNSRFILGIGQAFSSVTAAIASLEAPAIQYVGPAGIAKSALASVLSSTWGRSPDPFVGDLHGFGETWSHTQNNLEPTLTAHNHTLLVLDETRNTGAEKAAAQRVLDSVMKIQGGMAKGRFNDPGTRRSWLTGIISTSNLSVVELLHAAGQEFDPAYADRLIDIPPPTTGSGIFESLRGHSDLPSFVRRLKRLSAKHYGVAGRRFVQDIMLLHHYAPDELRAWIEERRAAYVRQACEIASPQRDLTRLHGRFATIYASCCLAAEFGLLELPHEEIGKAILQCERDHVTFIAQEIARLSSRPPLELLREYVLANRENFVDLRKAVPETTNGVPGYIARIKNDTWLLFPPTAIDAVVGGTQAALALKQSLHRQGDLLGAGAGKGHSRFARKHVLARKHGKSDRKYVIAIRRSVLK